MSERIPLKLHKIAEEFSYRLDYVPTVRRRGWPTPSARPWHLYYSDGSLCAAYGSLARLENALRARAGC